MLDRGQPREVFIVVPYARCLERVAFSPIFAKISAQFKHELRYVWSTEKDVPIVRIAWKNSMRNRSQLMASNNVVVFRGGWRDQKTLENKVCVEYI